MRRGYRYLFLGFAAVILVGAGIAYRLWKIQERVQPVLVGIPAIPDLGRWPAELHQRIAALTAAVAKSNPPEQPLGELAVLYLANGYAAEAEKALRVLCDREPLKPRWFYLLGTLRLRAGDKLEAQRFFESTVALAPDDPPALLQLGELLGATGRFDEARACFERRLKQRPNDSLSLFALAKLDYAQGNVDASIERLRPLVDHDPKFQEAHLMLGDLLEKKNDLRGAAEQRAFLRGGQASPPVADPWLDEVDLLSYDAYRMQAFGAKRTEAGLYENAVPYLQRAIALDPTDAEAYNLLVSAYLNLRRWKEAESLLESGFHYLPESDVLYVRWADLFVRQNRAAEALDRVKSAAERFPRKALLHSALGQIFLHLDRAEEAARALQEALKLDPLMADVQLNFGRALLKLGRRTDAKAAAAIALKMRPEDPDTLGMLATLELEDGEVDAAEQHVQSLVAAQPAQAEALDLFARVKLRKGNLLAEAGRHLQAEAIYRQGLSINSGFSQLHGALGMLYGKERRFPEAIAQFQRYLELSPSDPFGYILLGSAYATSGQIEEASAAWTRGLAVARETKDNNRISQLERLLKVE